MGALPVVGSLLSERAIRRRLEDLDPSLVVGVNPWSDFLLYGLRRLKLNGTRERLMFAFGNSFARYVARVARSSADTVVCYDTVAEQTFDALARSGVRRVLDLSHPHVQGFRILREERQLRPEWASSIDAPTQEKVIDRCLAEQHQADHILVASQFSKTCMQLDGVAPEKISVVPYGVDLERFHPAASGPPPSRLQALFVGQVGQRKGMSYLFDAAQQVERVPIDIVVAGALMGSGWAERSLPPNVRLLGRVREHHLPELYRAADVFVFPSLVEGFGLVLLEALASGLPVIATTHTAAPDLIERGKEGIVVPIRDGRALAESLVLLHEDRKLLQEMKVAARKKALEYSWATYRGRVCDALLGCGGGPIRS